MPPAIDHVIVLMLENRAFDHMIGYLRAAYPPGEFDGLSGTESNPDGRGVAVTVSDGASGRLAVGPDHSHAGVMSQLTGKENSTPHDPLTNLGFVRSYEHKTGGSGSEVMKCFAPARVPVLAALARGFTICDRWFCSVPGATWPNRNYVHAATSDGEVDIRRRFYRNRTIFAVMQDAGHEWAVYHRGPAQLWVFPGLWQSPFSRTNRWRPLDELPDDIRGRRIPAYTFVEPDHGLLWPRHRSNSQHPSNNYESPRDFYAGERLMLDIYAALIDTPDLFDRTLLIVTYDEHGGYYDHAHPPRRSPPAVAPDDKTGEFAFDVLGPRVPALLISPWIPGGMVDHTPFDHTSVPASLRERFASAAAPLTKRDASSKTLWHNLTLAAPRPQSEMPRPATLAEELNRVARSETGAEPGSRVLPGEAEPELDEFQQSLIDLAVEVDRRVSAVPPGQEVVVVDEAFSPMAIGVADGLQRSAAARAAYLEDMERRFRAG